MPRIKPASPTPDLAFDLIDGARFSLADEAIEKLLMVVVYRGLHCPVCKKYLEQLNGLLDRYHGLGVSVVTVSADPQARARKSRMDWDVDDLRIGFGLTEAQMRDWDLYVSTAIKEGETPLFAEPAVLLFKPDRSLYYAALNSMPFGRPDLEKLANSIEWMLENDYPARGTS